MNENIVIAGNLKRLREANGFTQEHVANYLGIGRSAYSNYETGDRECPLSVMESLCDLYGCDPYLLYEGDVNVVKNMLTTAFRVDDASIDDLHQIAAFKKVVKNYLKLDMLLAR